MRSWLSALVVLAACGKSFDPDREPPVIPPEVCATSYLTYENFGQPFVENWCRGCHSAGLPSDMRQKAPADVNFDTQVEVQGFAQDMAANAASAAPTMPPAGGPSEDERALLGEWLGCGAK
jgi:uncharacterized membrane protein